MNNPFIQKLTGGHPNSLGNTLEVVDEVLKDHSKLDELYDCYFSEDEVVRLRTSSAWKRVTKHDINLFLPYLDRFLEEISKIDQPSTKWTLAILFGLAKTHMSKHQLEKAIDVVKHNLATEKDWIVRVYSMEFLGEIAKSNSDLKEWLIPHLKRLNKDPKKVVPKKANLWLGVLGSI